MSNKHFERPIRSSRSSHDYGNTKLDKDEEFTLKTMLLGVGSMGLIFVAATFAAGMLP
jgi:hypothetical protein